MTKPMIASTPCCSRKNSVVLWVGLELALKTKYTPWRDGSIRNLAIFTPDDGGKTIVATGRKNKINMKYQIVKLLIFTLFLLFYNSCSESNRNIEKHNYKDMMIRIAEIEIDSVYLKEYISILKEESEASVRLEPGVICIYPMFQKENPTEIRLLEIYANKAEYESHLKTPHFQHYKTTTLKMVKSLRLIEMEAIDKETMVKIFAKIH